MLLGNVAKLLQTVLSCKKYHKAFECLAVTLSCLETSNLQVTEQLGVLNF